ncbi:MAG: ABC transporter ATP-binding protein [Clostridiales bacterium]|nr:ABC transporter ATP-binding protein [Clostridiales bacterium]
MDKGAIELKDVTKIFQRSDTEETLTALNHINLSIKPGEFVSFVGASGCGKSTLMRIITGLESPTKGEAICDGEVITGTSAKRGLVFQDHALFPWLTVWENVIFGLKSQKNLSEKQALAEELLKLVELEKFKKTYPSQLSGGMSQRVALIRALTTEPDVLLMDEPLGALDAFTRMNIQDVLIRLWETQKNTMILITHDVDEAVYLSQRVIVMSPRPGRIIDDIRIDMNYNRNRSHSDFLKYRNQILERLNLAHEESLEYYI